MVKCFRQFFCEFSKFNFVVVKTVSVDVVVFELRIVSKFFLRLLRSTDPDVV